MSAKKKDPYVATMAGAIAGGLEATFTWPTEFVKTQLQLQARSGEQKYTGAVHCARVTIREHGFFGLYRGLSPVLLGSLPKAGVRFGGFEFLSSFLRDEKGKMSPINNFLAGMGAGIIEAVVAVTPQETLKVKLINANKGFVEGTIYIIKNEGIEGIYKGVTPTIIKQASNQGIRFLTFGEYKKLIQKGDPNKQIASWQALLGGMLAGCCSTLGNNPIDVVKTRMQGLDSAKYKSTVDCILKIIREDGFLGFYKGTLPRLARVVPGQGLLFASYEGISNAVETFMAKKE